MDTTLDPSTKSLLSALEELSISDLESVLRRATEVRKAKSTKHPTPAELCRGANRLRQTFAWNVGAIHDIQEGHLVEFTANDLPFSILIQSTKVATDATRHHKLDNDSK